MIEARLDVAARELLTPNIDGVMFDVREPGKLDRSSPSLRLASIRV
jgi:hypothetical protein